MHSSAISRERYTIKMCNSTVVFPPLQHMAKIYFTFFSGEICARGREEEEGEGAPIDLAEAECRAVLDAAEGGGGEGLLEQLKSDTGTC